MISHKFKCIYVHIPKTAGSSIELFFEEYPKEQHVLGTKCIQTYGKTKWDNYFKFSFVRNPWDRLVSWFLWINRKNFYYDWQQESGFGGWDLKTEWGKDGGHPRVEPSWYLDLKSDFKKFIYSIEDTKNKDDYNLKDIKNATKGKWIASQSTWLKNARGKIAVDFIGKFENLEEDFKKICKKLNLEEDPLPLSKVLHNRPHYSQFYEKRTRDKVAKLYSDDIETFKYEYELKDEIQHKL